MRHATIAVIGHVDHGKTSLVKALTGIDTDQLKEEKARGLSIALGFASIDAGETLIHLIDAPGHADFVRTTASGMSGARAVLLVVSAKDGVKTQTREHMKLAQLFGIKTAIVALTKIDQASDERARDVAEEIATILKHNLIAPSAIVPVSSVTGAGLESLAGELRACAEKLPQPPVLDGFFLPIDRVFSAAGAGSIVTGTLLGAALKVDDEVEIGPHGIRASVRGLQIIGVAQDVAPAGTRVAVSLRGADVSQLARGQVLAAPRRFKASYRFDVELASDASLKHMDHVEVLFGTTHVAARLRLYPALGQSPRYGQLEFSSPHTGHPGQAFILRRPASAEIVTGGSILDPNAKQVTRNKPAHVAVLRSISSGKTDALAHALADRDHGRVDLTLLTRLSASSEGLDVTHFTPLETGYAIRIAELEALEKALCAQLAVLHDKYPLRPFISQLDMSQSLRPVSESALSLAIARSVAKTLTKSTDLGVALKDHDPLIAMTEEQSVRYRGLEDQLQAAGLQALNQNELSDSDDQDLVDLLVWQNRAIRLYNHSLKQTLILHRDAVDKAWHSLSTAFPSGRTFTTGDARKSLETNRKTIVPLLEYFDQQGRTQRSGDVRSVKTSNANTEAS